MVKTIPLTRGYVAIVDDEDYEWLSQWKWHVQFNPAICYAVRRRWKHEYTPGNIGRVIYMHRAVLGVPEGQRIYVDHIDHEGLNNCRSNLRLGSQGLNLANQRKGGGSSRYKGVHWSKDKRKWRVQIKTNGKKRTVGCFMHEEEAARAYDEAAIEQWGVRAWLNFPE